MFSMRKWKGGWRASRASEGTGRNWSWVPGLSRTPGPLSIPSQSPACTPCLQPVPLEPSGLHKALAVLGRENGPAEDSVQTLGMTEAVTSGKVLSPLLPPPTPQVSCSPPRSAVVPYAGQHKCKWMWQAASPSTEQHEGA